MTEAVHRRELSLRLTREEIRQVLHTGQQQDIEQGGLYDARSGCINIWCTPEDKPGCWNVAIEAAGLNYPRSYVGALDWEWNVDDTAELFVEVEPYDLLDRYDPKEISADDWDELLRWTEAKARQLLGIAQASPQVIGTHCPFCAYVLASGGLINGLLDHITEAHPQESVRSLILGKQTELVTNNDAYPLLPATQK